MNARETQKLIKQSIIKNIDSNYKIVKGDYLIKYPIRDIITGFCFEGSSGENDFYLWYFAQPSYRLSNHFYLSYGDRIKNKNGISSWNLIGALNFTKNTIEEVISTIKEKSVFIEEMGDPEKFYSNLERQLKKHENWRFDETLVYTAFWLKKPDAKSDAIDLIKYIETHDDLTLDWVKQCRDSLRELVDSHDPVSILQMNREQTIKNLKL